MCLQIEKRKKDGESLRTFFGGAEQTEEEVRVSQVLSDIADAHGVESVTTICLACESSGVYHRQQANWCRSRCYVKGPLCLPDRWVSTKAILSQMLADSPGANSGRKVEVSLARRRIPP